MPAFCNKCNGDMVICQECGRDLCVKEHNVKWVEPKGNVCKDCRDGKIRYPASQWNPQPGNRGYDLMC
jgi:hypothetical protein